jgi:hypothetical protein
MGLYQRGEQTPQFTLPDGFKVCLWRDTEQASAHVTGHVTGQVFINLRQEERLVVVIEGEMKSAEIQSVLQLKHRDNFRDTYLNPALDQGLVEMTIPDKPQSSKQKYRLTTKGQQLKAEVLREQ